MGILYEEGTEHAPWSRQPNEPTAWFERFSTWLHQPKPRSLLLIYNRAQARKGKRSDAKTYPHAWFDAKEKYRWTERAMSFDLAEQRRKDCEWSTAREAEREEELVVARALRNKGFELLSLPIRVEKEIRDRHGALVEYRLMVEHRAFSVAAQVFAEALRHSRGALEMPNTFTRQEITGRDTGPVEIKHVGETPEQQLEKLLDLATRASGPEGGSNLFD